MSVYLDTNVFFFAGFGDDNDPRTKKAKDLIIKVSERKEIAYTSLITIDELIWAVIRKKGDRKAAIQQGLRLHQLPIRFIPLITSISLRSLHLMQRHQINPRDALHAASCIEVKAESLVTDDDDFDRITEIKRSSLR